MEAFGSFTTTIPAPGKRLATSESKNRLPDGIDPVAGEDEFDGSPLALRGPLVVGRAEEVPDERLVPRCDVRVVLRAWKRARSSRSCRCRISTRGRRHQKGVRTNHTP